MLEVSQPQTLTENAWGTGLVHNSKFIVGQEMAREGALAESGNPCENDVVSLHRNCSVNGAQQAGHSTIN